MKKLVTYLSIEKNRFGLEVLDRIDVQNDPVNVFDPNGLKPSLSDLVNYYVTLDEAAQKDCNNVIKDGNLSSCCDQFECQICMRKLCELYGPPGTSTYGLCWIHVHKLCAPCN